jgi:hypothetical protein
MDFKQILTTFGMIFVKEKTGSEKYLKQIRKII